MGAVSDAIRASAESFGAEIRVDTPVDKVLVKDGRAAGVVVAGGEEFHAPVVITACHPQITFLRQVDRAELPEDFVEDIEQLAVALGHGEDQPRARPAARVHGRPRVRPGVHGGAITILDDLEYLETAFQEARAGQAGHRAVRRLRDPHGVRPHARARGQARDVDVHAVGAGVAGATEPHREELEAYAERLFDRFEVVAPGFKDSILHRQIIGPYDMEQEYGLIGGNIFHGELTVDQLFHMRPAVGYADYRTPIRGLYQASQRDPCGRRRDRPPRPPRGARDPQGQGALGMGAIRTETRDGILELTIDRPPANAIDSATSRELGDVFVAFRDDPSLRVAVLTGAGDRFFSAGWDLKAAAAGEAEDYGAGGFAGLTERFDLDKPVIAAVNGWAAGGGFELALACDLIVASRTARFMVPEVNLGFVAGRRRGVPSARADAAGDRDGAAAHRARDGRRRGRPVGGGQSGHRARRGLGRGASAGRARSRPPRPWPRVR